MSGSKILSYADSVISNFNTTLSEFGGNILGKGNLTIKGDTELEGVSKFKATGSTGLVVDTADSIASTSYKLPVNAVPLYDSANPSRKFFMKATPAVSPGQVDLEWDSFDAAGVQIEDVNGIDISNPAVGNLVYVSDVRTVSGQVIPTISMNKEDSYKIIEEQDILTGSLVRNDDEMLITTNQLSGSGKSLAKIYVKDLIQSVQILATDIQVIGYANNKVVTQDKLIRIEVDSDGLGSIVTSTFSPDGFVSEKPITGESFRWKMSSSYVDVIGTELDASSKKLGYNFVRGAKTLALQFDESQDMSLQSHKLSFGGGSANLTLDANSFILFDAEGAFLKNKGFITVDEGIGLQFSNTFTCSFDTVLDQNVGKGGDVEFTSLINVNSTSLANTVIGDRTGTMPWLEAKPYTDPDDSLDKFNFYSTSSVLYLVPGFEAKLSGGKEFKADSTKLSYNGRIECPGAVLDTAGSSIFSNLDLGSNDLTSFNVTADSSSGTVAGKYFTGGDLNLDNQAICKIVYIQDSASTTTITLDGASGGGFFDGVITADVVTADSNLYLGTTPITSSSLILKENVNSLENSMDTIMKMKPVSYTRKNRKTNHKEIGFIAEDMEKVLPDIVAPYNENKGIRYTEIIPVLVSALQEQQKKIELLESKISK